MNKSSLLTVALLLIWGLFFAVPHAFSHQQKSAISTISFNPNTQKIEIAHRFRIHDAEHAVKHIFDKDADIIASEQTKEQFSDYVNQHFSMLVDDKHIVLSNVGYENDGQFFWVYQETAKPPKLTNLSIRHDALRDIWPSQINTINIEGNGKLQTLTFSDSVELLKVSF